MLPCQRIKKLLRLGRSLTQFSFNVNNKLHIQKEEIQERDHRFIGRTQDLFTFHKLSPGSAFFLPHGTKIYNKLIEFIRNLYRQRGYKEIITPNLYLSDLWVQSGHYDKYKEHIYFIEDEDQKQQIGLKPMNCPGHCLLFSMQQFSFKDLPLRYADFGVLHRNEVHGSLSGLTRVRRFVQDDAHIFCATDQIQSEMTGILEMIDTVYKVLGFEYNVGLSTRPKEYIGTLEIWDQAESQLTQSLQNRGVKFDVHEGEGAFYGPKIDFHLKDSLGRSHQCGTVQLDFNLPLKFNLQYRTSKQEHEIHEEEVEGHHLKLNFERPVLIHRAVLGSVERMIAVLTEQYNGRWPFWLSPRQMLVISVNEKATNYAQLVHDELFKQGFNVEIDLSDHTLSKKIREAQILHFNYMIVLGLQEEQENTIVVRERDSEGKGKQQKMTLQEFIAQSFNRAKNYN